jgi:hypothetical protein
MMFIFQHESWKSRRSEEERLRKKLAACAAMLEKKRTSGRAFEAARRPRFVIQLLEVPMVERERLDEPEKEA